MAKHKSLKFNWDAEKAVRNIEKYDITFDEASTIFTDRHAIYLDDAEHSQKEKREMVIARAPARKRLLTCFFTRIDGVIHIISARRSTHGERREYDENSEKKKTTYQIK
jgi:uncharacterized protein